MVIALVGAVRSGRGRCRRCRGWRLLWTAPLAGAVTVDSLCRRCLLLTVRPAVAHREVSMQTPPNGRRGHRWPRIMIAIPQQLIDGLARLVAAGVNETKSAAIRDAIEVYLRRHPCPPDPPK